MLLEQQPEILPLFGLDAEIVREEIEKSKAAERARKQPSAEKEAARQKTMELNSKKWADWVARYVQVLEATEERKNLGDSYWAARAESMNVRVNPKFILRNYLLEEAISKAEANDFSEVDSMLKLALEPFGEEEAAACERPDWRFDICVSCSS